MSQPFWTSKTFWTLILGLLTFVLNKYFQIGIPDEIIAGVMGVLALLFRWVADQPLGITSNK